MSNSAMVYRYWSRVAVRLPNGPTVYLTADDAARLAKVLNRTVRNIKTEPRFSTSKNQNDEWVVTDPFYKDTSDE
jgi:hypothetical protein